MNINTKFKMAICILLSIVCCLVSTACSSKPQTIGEGSEFIVVYSRSREKSGGIFCISEDGSITNELAKLEMQDLSFYSFNENNLLISGGRSNNNLLFDLSKEGLYAEIHWLGEPNYSGVTAVELTEQAAFVVMNGNYSENTYLNLVVEQDLQGNVIHQNVIELYCRDVLLNDGKAVLSGKHLKKENNENVWAASIIEYDIENQKILTQTDFEQYNCFWEIELYDGLYYCLTEGKNELKNIICVIDPATKNVIREFAVEDQLIGLDRYGDAIYAVGNTAVFKQSAKQEFDAIITDICFDGTYANWAYVYENAYYIFSRLQQREQVDNAYKYGELIKVDLDTLETTSTPVEFKKSVTMDDILIFPAQMFQTK